MVYDSATEGIAALSVGINDVPAGARRMGLRFRDQGDGTGAHQDISILSQRMPGNTYRSRVEINHRSIDENLTPKQQGTRPQSTGMIPMQTGTYTYALVNDNTTDNSSFSISGNDISPTRMFDYELEKVFPESADHR